MFQLLLAHYYYHYNHCYHNCHYHHYCQCYHCFHCYLSFFFGGFFRYLIFNIIIIILTLIFLFLFLFQFGLGFLLFDSQLIYCLLLIFFGKKINIFSCGVFSPSFVCILHQNYLMRLNIVEGIH